MAVLVIILMWFDHETQTSVGKQPRDADMILVEGGMNPEGAMSMNAEKAGRINGMKGTTTPTRAKGCVHHRMVNYHYNENAQPSGNLVCRECGAVIPDPVKVLRYR